MNNIDESMPLICIYLHIRGHDLEPEYITKMLSIKPCRTRRLGEVTGKVRPIVAKNGYWGLRSMNFISEYDLDVNKHLDAILNFTTMNLLELDGVEEAEVDIFIAHGDNNEGGVKTIAFDISQENLCLLSELGITLAVTTTTMSPEESMGS